MGLLDKLRGLFAGKPESTPPTAPAADPAASDMSRPLSKQVLLTRRVADPAASTPGFAEAYFCTACGDYFVLAWHPRDSPLAQECDAVSQGPQGRPPRPGRTRVFCPACGKVHAMYGVIQEHAAARQASSRHAAPRAPVTVTVDELLEFPFPPDVPSSPAGRVRLGDMTVERIVFLIRGTFPAGMDAQQFVCAGIHDEIESNFDGDLFISEHGGVRAHVLRIGTLDDEDEWLTGVLMRHVYRTDDWGTRMFVTSPIVKLKPPMDQCMFCFVLGDD